VRVEVLSGTTVVAWDETASDGSFLIEQVPVGKYEIRFNGPGMVDVIRGPVEVVAGQTAELGLEKMALARGGVTGIFHRAGIAGDRGKHHRGDGLRQCGFFESHLRTAKVRCLLRPRYRWCHCGIPLER